MAIDFDSPWRTQDEIRTAVNAVLGESVWNLGYSQDRTAIELELSVHLEEDEVSNLCSQFPVADDYDGEGAEGSKFVFFL